MVVGHSFHTNGKGEIFNPWKPSPSNLLKEFQCFDRLYEGS